MDCWDSSANAAIMWQCVPVPAFGNHKSPSVCVATVGLNPSATEFLNDKRDWKPATKRLPLVIDFGVRERDRVSAANLEQAANLRAKYFKRTPHAWFNPLQGLLSALNTHWNYSAGTAVHVDLVACGTWRAWKELSTQTTKELVKNCRNHLKRTLTELPDGTLLLLDGGTVNTTLAGFGKQVEEKIENVTVWHGSLRIEGKCFKYAGWSTPINYLPNWYDLVLWLRGVTAQ